MYLCFLKIILASICSVLEFWVVTAIQILKALASHMASPYRLVLSLESMVSDNSHMPPSQEFKRQATTMIFFPIKNYWQCQPWTEQEAPFYVVLPSLNQIINCLLLQTKKSHRLAMVLHTCSSQLLESWGKGIGSSMPGEAMSSLYGNPLCVLGWGRRSRGYGKVRQDLTLEPKLTSNWLTNPPASISKSVEIINVSYHVWLKKKNKNLKPPRIINFSFHIL